MVRLSAKLKLHKTALVLRLANSTWLEEEDLVMRMGSCYDLDERLRILL